MSYDDFIYYVLEEKPNAFIYMRQKKTTRVIVQIHFKNALEFIHGYLRKVHRAIITNSQKILIFFKILNIFGCMTRILNIQLSSFVTNI